MDRPTFLLLLLCVGITVSSAVDLQKRIYGGQDCKLNECPYHVALSSDPAGQISSIFCGGSLISDQWILTAEHCKEDTIYAVLGVNPVKPTDSQTTVEITTERILFPDYDIMFLKLLKPTKYPFISLPSKKECDKKPAIGKRVKVAGFGWCEADQNTKLKVPSMPKNLQCVEMNVADCQFGTTKTYLGIETDRLFCGGGPKEVTGPGDSGGGVVHNKKLYGVVIGSPGYVCTRPGVFVDICAFLENLPDFLKNHNIPK